MRKLHRLRERVFRVLCLSVSAIMLLASLLCRVSYMWTEGNIEHLNCELQSCQYEGEILMVKLENQIALAQLDDIARQKFAMQKPDAGQMFYLIAG